MSVAVTIKQGSYLNKPITNKTFSLVKGFTLGTKGGFITVQDGDRRFRVRVDSEHDFEVKHREVVHESDETIMKRIGTRFRILDDMTRAATRGDVRALIVVGPPGVGKSFGVENQLRKFSVFDTLGDESPRYEVVKGAITPIGLYSVLYRHSDSGHVIVFDDCDSVFYDDLSLNLLKAALDSNRRRRICWNADSHFLRREGIPEAFDFKGSVIFITNIDFQNIKSRKLQDHLEALNSRCHYLDLTMRTERDKILRIRQIFEDGDLFRDYDFSEDQGKEIIDYVIQNQHRLREISIRMCLKVADLVTVSTEWRELAEATCLKGV